MLGIIFSKNSPLVSFARSTITLGITVENFKPFSSHRTTNNIFFMENWSEITDH
jgi:hypothetical protein